MTKSKPRTEWAAALLSLAVAGSASSLAVEPSHVTLEAIRDNTLYESPTGQFSNGAGSELFVGRTRGRLPGTIRRALVMFDVARHVPPGSTIRSAVLEMRMSRTRTGPTDVSVHRVLASWGEGDSNANGQEGRGAPARPTDATWIHRFFDTEMWQTPGGDFDPLPSAVTPVAGFGVYAFGPSDGLVADVQSWVDDPSGNHGWILLGDETRLGTAKRFDSREQTAAAFRPRLILEFDPPVPMARFDVELLVAELRAAGRDRVDAAVAYRTGDDSDGVDPETEGMHVALGALEIDLPAGDWRCGPTGCRFASAAGAAPEVSALLTTDRIALRIEGADLSGTAWPATLAVRIGDDVGSAEVRPAGRLELGGRLIRRPEAGVPGAAPRSAGPAGRSPVR